MNSAQTVKIGKKTATITFSFDNEFKLQQIKALAVAWGVFNPLRNDFIDIDKMQVLKRELRENCTIENAIYDVMQNIK